MSKKKGNGRAYLHRIWMLIVRVSLFLCVIWVAFQLYEYIKPNLNYLKAYGRHYTYHFPDSIKKEIGKINHDELRENVRNFSETNSVLIVSLKNQDDKEIADIFIEVPFDGIFQIVDDERVIYSSKFSRKIPVDSLQAGNDINIVAWTNSWTTAPQGRYDKRYKITHPCGVSYVDFSIEVRGFIATIIDYGFANLFILTSVFLLVLTSFSIIIVLLLRKE